MLIPCMSYHHPANSLMVWASHAINTDTAIAPTNTNCSSSCRSPCLRRPCHLDFTRAVYGGPVLRGCFLPAFRS
jgi:hypothetical protein